MFWNCMFPPNFAGLSISSVGFSRKIMYLQMSMIGLNFVVFSGQNAFAILVLISCGVS